MIHDVRRDGLLGDAAALVSDVRPFPVPRLLDSVNRVLATMRPESRVAVIAIADRQHAGLYGFVRIADGVSFMGKFDKTYGGQFDAEAALVFER